MAEQIFKVGQTEQAETAEQKVAEQQVAEETQTTETATEQTQDDSDFNPQDYFAERFKNPEDEKQTEKAETTEQKASPSEKQTQEEINAYTWAEKTGKSPEEFFKYNRDFSTMETDDLIKSFYKENGDLTDDEADWLFNKKYGEYSELDEMEQSIAKKGDRKDALKFFEKMKTDLGITNTGAKKDAPKEQEVPEQYKQAMEVYSELAKNQAVMKTNAEQYQNLLNEHYKTFEGIDIQIPININGAKKDVSFNYVPNKDGAKRIGDVQTNIQAMFDSYIEQKEDGTIEFKNPKGLFDTLAKAAIVDDLLKFVFEQGGAYYTDNLVEQELKRPDFKGREAGRAGQGAPVIRVVK